MIDEICSELSIRRIKTAPYHAQANGKLENFHKLLISSIKKNIQYDAWEWDKVIPKVLFAYCVTPHLVGSYSPFFALMGRDPVVLIHTLLRSTVKYMDEAQHKYDLLMMHYVLTKLAKNITKQRQNMLPNSIACCGSIINFLLVIECIFLITPNRNLMTNGLRAL